MVSVRSPRSAPGGPGRLRGAGGNRQIVTRTSAPATPTPQAYLQQKVKIPVKDTKAWKTVKERFHRGSPNTCRCCVEAPGLQRPLAAWRSRVRLRQAARDRLALFGRWGALWGRVRLLQNLRRPSQPGQTSEPGWGDRAEPTGRLTPTWLWLLRSHSVSSPPWTPGHRLWRWEEGGMEGPEPEALGQRAPEGPRGHFSGRQGRR